VTKRVRVRFELENHAHDIYDAFGGLHTQLVRKSTYFTLEALRSLIAAAHRRDFGSRGRPVVEPKNPIMGRDVLVTNLWHVRDIWEWLMPGKDSSTAAFVSYENLQAYRDFTIMLEPNSSPNDVRVGLWAKQFMSDPDDKLIYIGTLLTTKLWQSVAAGKKPGVAAMTSRAEKTAKEAERLAAARAMVTGKYGGQYSAERMADCIAMLARNWQHFDRCAGNATGDMLMLPHELAEKIKRSRVEPLEPSEPESAVHEARPFVDLVPGQDATPLRQVAHGLAATAGVQRSLAIPLVVRGTGRVTTEQFAALPIVAGCMVLTRASPHCALGKHCRELSVLPYWAWRVLNVFGVGAELPANSRHARQAEECCYEAHLYSPASGGNMKDILHPCWDVQSELLFLRTPEEKARRRDTGRAEGERASEGNRRSVVHVPLRAFLRPKNIIGGGFQLTRASRLPQFALAYVEHVLSREFADQYRASSNRS